MDNLTYFNRLKERYERYYDVYEGGEGSRFENMDLLASYSIISSKSMFTKDIKVQVIEEYEHCFVRMFREKVTFEHVRDFAEEVVSYIDLLVKPNEDHKKTVLTGVIISEKGCTPEASVAVRKFRYKRSFRFQLYGWCEIRLILVDLCNDTIYHNVTGLVFKKQVEQFYNFLEEQKKKFCK